MKISYLSRLGSVLMISTSLWSQAGSLAGQGDTTSPTSAEDRMVTPAAVSGEAYPMSFSSETRSNYLLGSLGFSSAYSDNVLGGIGAHPVSDISYSVWPTLTFDITRSRLSSFLSYSPGFTFYQHTTARNETDQNLSLDLHYRLSPHVTLTVLDSFHQSSNILNQQNVLPTNPVIGPTEPLVQSVIPPLANQLSNTGKLEATYQFRPNGMVGFTGTALDLHYPDPAQVPGLFDSSSRGGSAFYTHRLSGIHYIGLTYEFQLLRAFPTGWIARTRTHSALFFYTAYLKSNVSLSLFAGPQYADTEASIAPRSRTWSPGAGASLGWQGRLTSFAASYTRTIASSGGLIGAVHQDSATISLRRQLSRWWSAGVDGNYALNTVLSPIPLFSTGGHTISGTASVQRQFGEHFNCGMGYTRLHQSYNHIEAVSGVPDTNREWVSISYQFTRPLGR